MLPRPPERNATQEQVLRITSEAVPDSPTGTFDRLELGALPAEQEFWCPATRSTWPQFDPQFCSANGNLSEVSGYGYKKVTIYYPVPVPVPVPL